MKRIAMLLLVPMTAAWVSAASAITIFDPTDWTSGWSYSNLTLAGAGTAAFTVEAAGGNPGARLNSTTVTPTSADTAFGLAVYQGTTVPAPPSGTAYVMHIDALSGAGGFGQGQAVWVLVEQAGSIYYVPIGITGWPLAVFTTTTYNGTFTPGLFTKAVGAGPANPVFDGTTPTHFGFAVGNSMSATLTQYYDNWNITFALPPSAAATPVPALGPLAMLLLALLVGGVALRANLRKH